MKAILEAPRAAYPVSLLAMGALSALFAFGLVGFVVGWFVASTPAATQMPAAGSAISVTGVTAAVITPAHLSATATPVASPIAPTAAPVSVEARVTPLTGVTRNNIARAVQPAVQPTTNAMPTLRVVKKPVTQPAVTRPAPRVAVRVAPAPAAPAPVPLVVVQSAPKVDDKGGGGKSGKSGDNSGPGGGNSGSGKNKP